MIGLYLMLLGGRSWWVTAVAFIVFSSLGYLVLNLFNYLGLVESLAIGNWAFVSCFMVVAVLVACFLDRKSKKPRKR